MRLSPQEWPKVGRETAKYQLKKIYGVIISNLIVRTDNTKANSTIRKTNTLIKELQTQTVHNSNISEKHLGKRGLHLNQEDNTIFAIYYTLSEIFEIILIMILFVTIIY